MDLREDQRLRTIALEKLESIMDDLREYPTRSDLRNLDLPVATPHLVDRQKRIWNPRWLLATLSVVTVLDGPYPDKEIARGVWEYRYRSGGVEGDNRKLQRASDLEVDLAYFREIPGGRYVPEFPVRIIQNDPSARKVLIARKELDRIDWQGDESAVSTSLRSWAMREVKVRQHQRRFRERVLDAYAIQCAVCSLPIAGLLDAAHIDADSSIDGEPVISNGLALCKLHHYAYDTNVMGITPSRRIHLADRARQHVDNTMVAQSLLAFDGARIRVPAIGSHAPGEERLARRWSEFRKTASVR